MIFLTQLIYVKEGQEKLFHQFEDIVLPLMATFGGQLLLRIRPTQDSILNQQIETPYEIHLVTFPDNDALERFINDEGRKRVLYMKEDSVRSVLLFKGVQVG